MEFKLPDLEGKEYKGKGIDIILYSNESSVKEQIGYSVKPNGDSLYGFEEGDWQEGWYVIGRESQCGDPIFIDLNDPDIPVYTAMHGAGIWNEELLASSYKEFIDMVKSKSPLRSSSGIWQFFYENVKI
jgi:hypothetical protein